MISTTDFVLVVLVCICLLGAILHLLNWKDLLNWKAAPLRKAWTVYGAMYILHAIFCAGLFLSLPSTTSSLRSEADKNSVAEPISDVSLELRRQRREIDDLKDQIHSTTQTIFFAAYILALFAPMLYYNLFKYNLEIERLSGKRMGSFD